MKRFLLFIALITVCVANAQNFQCLQFGPKHYFINGKNYLRGIRIDSVRPSGSSTIYYPFHTPRGRYNINSVLDSTGGSWLGKKVLQLSDGTFLFDNMWHDTVVIKTYANVGDSWVFYNDTTTLYYQADLISADTMSVLGSVDSIKRILITARNPLGIVTSDPVDSFQLILSKNHGFVQVIDLYTFPYHDPGVAFNLGLDLYLDEFIINHYGILRPSKTNSVFSLIDLVNPTLSQLYQWNMGDVYQYASCYNRFEHFPFICEPAEKYNLDTIILVSITPGNSNYHFSGTESNSLYYLPGPPSPADNIIYLTTANSGILNYDSTLIIDTTLMPEEFHQHFIYSYTINDTSYCQTNTLYSVQKNIFIHGITYNPPMEFWEDPSLYKAPLGLLSSLSSGFGTAGASVVAQKLIYYNRGGISCGSLATPPTSLQNVIPNQISILPNPVTNELTITAINNIKSIAIYNLVGQKVFTCQYNSQNVQINVVGLQSGLYFLRINETEVMKFVKQ